VAALASWLDARSHGGRWLVRIEDVDTPRCVPGAAETILSQLAACGLHPDAPPLYQSDRGAAYQAALDKLVSGGLAYPCACSRADIERQLAASGHLRVRGLELPYPGTCRDGLFGRPARAWRFRSPPGETAWHDRRLGAQRQDVAQAVGDFVLKRADGLWAYQLAVVVDDAAQGITHVVRGEDLADNTPRQLLLQEVLGVPHPAYLHAPLVLGTNSEKLSKQNGARALDVGDPLGALNAAASVLGLHAHGGPVAAALESWTAAWPFYNRPGD